MSHTFEYSPLLIGCMRLGSWGVNLERKSLQAFVEECLALGLVDFDHADIYGDYTTEAQFGSMMKELPGLRQRLRITTKCGIRMVTPNRPLNLIKSYDFSRDYIVGSVEQSLQNFGTDYIDVLLLHRPDLLMNPEEVAETFKVLQESGKVLHFGVSNFTTDQFQALYRLFPLVTNQIEYSPVHLTALTDGTLLQCLSEGVQPTIWSPFGGGRLFNEEGYKVLRNVIQGLSAKYELTPEQLVLSWIGKHPSKPIPVLGTSRIEKIKLAKEGLKREISAEDWYRLLEVSRGFEVA